MTWYWTTTLERHNEQTNYLLTSSYSSLCVCVCMWVCVCVWVLYVCVCVHVLAWHVQNAEYTGFLQWSEPRTSLLGKVYLSDHLTVQPQYSACTMSTLLIHELLSAHTACIQHHNHVASWVSNIIAYYLMAEASELQGRFNGQNKGPSQTVRRWRERLWSWQTHARGYHRERERERERRHTMIMPGLASSTLTKSLRLI